MADLGAISLWIALALAAYSTVGSVAGKLRTSPALVESAQSAMYAAGLVLLVATLSLIIAFISRDFEIAYVAAHSDLARTGEAQGLPAVHHSGPDACVDLFPGRDCGHGQPIR